MLSATQESAASRRQAPQHAGGAQYQRLVQFAAVEQGRARHPALRHACSLPAKCAARWSSSRSTTRPKPSPPLRKWPASAPRRWPKPYAPSRLERIGLVENLISEHNITGSGRLDEGQRKLPPVLMRAYRNQAELMAVFTRPCTVTALTVDDFGFVKADVDIPATCLLMRWWPAGGGRQYSALWPTGHGQDGTGRWLYASDLVLFEAEYADRDGNSPTAAIGTAHCRLPRYSRQGRCPPVLLFDEVEDVFRRYRERLRWMSRSDTDADLGSSINGKAWVNQVLQPMPCRPSGLPTASSRLTRLSGAVCLPPGTEIAAARRSG